MLTRRDINAPFITAEVQVETVCCVYPRLENVQTRVRFQAV
jgi:hypothetical protein